MSQGLRWRTTGKAVGCILNISRWVISNISNLTSLVEKPLGGFQPEDSAPSIQPAKGLEKKSGFEETLHGGSLCIYIESIQIAWKLVKCLNLLSLFGPLVDSLGHAIGFAILSARLVTCHGKFTYYRNDGEVCWRWNASIDQPLCSGP